jgi:hypothetical protein
MIGVYAGCNTPWPGRCDDGTVPNHPKTPVRSIRIADDIYFPAAERAKSEGRTISDVVRELLSEYIDDNQE